MRITQTFSENVPIQGKKIIIYGAGRYGELAYKGLKHIGIEPDFFVDRGLSGNSMFGKPVISPNELSKYKEDIFLIASYNYFGEMINNLKAAGVSNYYDIEGLIKQDIKDLSEYAMDEKMNIQKYINVIENQEESGLVINHCEVVVTEKCTLRCRDCANLMQYYKKPEDLDIHSIVNDVNNLASCVDYILELRILGGEPFIQKDIDKLISVACSCEKIKRVTIYTNATVLPNKDTLKVMCNDKLCVHVSDYRINRNRLNIFIEKLMEHKISYFIHKYENWFDVGNVEKKLYSKEQADSIFNQCMMAKCYTLYRGRLYLCPRAAHGERLGYFKNENNEYVDLRELGSLSDKQNEIKNLFCNKRAITACFYCNGSSHKSKQIPAAIQLKKEN